MYHPAQKPGSRPEAAALPASMELFDTNNLDFEGTGDLLERTVVGALPEPVPMRTLMHWAADGDPDAQYEAAERLRHRSTLPIDREHAYLWYRTAANQGHTDARYRLGLCYLRGDGCEKDAELALGCFWSAANDGHVEARVAAGWCLQHGEGTEIDRSGAVRLYDAAANAGSAVGHFNLGVMYAEGDSDRGRNLALALKHWHEAADRGFVSAQVNLGIAHLLGRGTEVDEAQALRWLERAAANDPRRAGYVLGIALSVAEPPLRNLERAETLLRSAAERGQNDAALALGELYLREEATVGMRAEAVRWLRRAAQSGHVPAQLRLSRAYDRGRGIERNDVLAAFWLRLAADSGDASAQYDYGRRCLQGEETGASAREAVEWFRRAAVQGHLRAQYSLGICFATGKQVEQNLSLAYCWLEIAARRGLRKAGHKLEALERGLDTTLLREGRRLVARKQTQGLTAE